MGGLLRLLMICLLVLALPAQGVAAATRAWCSASHPPAGHAGAQVLAGAAPAHRQATASAPDAHVHPAMAAPDDSAGQGHAPNGAGQHAPSSQPDHHKCSACAACCSVGAIPSTVLTVPVAELSRTVFAPVPSTIAAFAADGPERPPRGHSA